MSPTLSRRSASVCAIVMFFLLATIASIRAQAPAAPVKIACTADITPPSDGDTAVAKTDYDTALTYFRAAVAKEPSSQEARLGVVRSLIGKNQVAEAVKEAADAIALDPHSPIAEVAAAEAAYRNADFDDMHAHTLKAKSYNRCEGRALALAAQYYSIHAYFGTAARLLADAHNLRPNDEMIRRSWIYSLPRKQRETELSKYLGEPNALSEQEHSELTSAEEHLKAHRDGECRVTSKADNVTVPFTLLYGDGDKPTAFGLDVAFNNKKRHMQIDTGSSGITLSQSAAKSLGLVPEYKFKILGIGDEGDIDAYLTHVANIQIGAVQVSDCMVEVLSSKAKLNVDGLIGLDVFTPWITTLDYPNQKLILTPLPPRPGDAALDAVDDERAPQDAIAPPAMKDWLHVIRIDHQILLPAFVNQGTLHYLMADTGADLTTLSLAYAKQSGKVHFQDAQKFQGISGEVKKVYYIENAALSFGGVGLPPTDYYAFDLTNLSHASNVEISGIVGLDTLSRLTLSIDYRDDLVQMKYDIGHDIKRF
jgi:tetratricopeptide (TPR) repeat protein